jgi:hypothetical protein
MRSNKNGPWQKQKMATTKILIETFFFHFFA